MSIDKTIRKCGPGKSTILKKKKSKTSKKLRWFDPTIKIKDKHKKQQQFDSELFVTQNSKFKEIIKESEIIKEETLDEKSKQKTLEEKLILFESLPWLEKVYYGQFLSNKNKAEQIIQRNL